MWSLSEQHQGWPGLRARTHTHRPAHTLGWHCHSSQMMGQPKRHTLNKNFYLLCFTHPMYDFHITINIRNNSSSSCLLGGKGGMKGERETGSSLQPGLVSNLLSCSSLPSARIAGVHYRIWLRIALNCVLNSKESNNRHTRRADNPVSRLPDWVICCLN